LHCSPLRNCIRQKTADGEWHSFVCPFDHLSVLFIRTLMSRAIKLNSGLKCFSCTKLKVSLERGQSKSPFLVTFQQDRSDTTIISISHHILSIRPSIHQSVSQSASQSFESFSFAFRFRFQSICLAFLAASFFPFSPLHTFFGLQTLFVCFYRFVLRIRNKKCSTLLVAFLNKGCSTGAKKGLKGSTDFGTLPV